MAKIIHVTPAPGLVVRDPNTMQPLPEAGLDLEKSSHWIRREKEGDVTITEIKAAAASAKPAKSAASAAKE